MPARKPKLLFIFFTLLLDVLGFGLLIPVAPKLVERFLGLAEQGQEGKAAWAVGALMATYACMQFVFAPILGSLSDRFGRRPLILISLLGSGLDYLAAAAAALWFPHLWILFVTRAINGISGANMSVCNAYIADITPPDKRAAGYGILGAAFGLGFVIGPLMGGVLGDPKNTFPLIGQGGLHLPYIAAGLLTLFNWLYGCFVLPESLPLDRRRPFSFRSANPVASLAWITRHRVVRTLAASQFLLNTAQFGLHATWVLSMSNRFAWSTTQTGWSLFTVGICAAVVQGFVARKAVRALGERACLLGGLIIGVFAFIGYGLATESWMVYAIIAVGSIGGVSGPALQSILSKAVPPNEQGLLQGSLAGLASIATIIGTVLASQIFGFFTSDDAPFRFAGAPFVSGAVLCLLSIVPAIAVWKRLPSEPAQPTAEATA